MRWILIAVCLLFKASATQISGYGNTTAEYGGDAHYRCAVAIATGVLQVTWQRLVNEESIENLATYNKRSGQQVNEPYRGKVIFTEASLSSTSITLKNVTWEDESCYICSFNVYPDGSKRRQTCLTVQGISKVNTSHVIISGHDKEHREVVFNCLATGKPAPTIQWDYSSGATSTDQSETIVNNSDRTSTSSSSITLRIPPDWKGHVDCLLNSGMKGQRQERIPFSLSDEHGEKEKGKGLSQLEVSLVVCAVIFVSCIVVAVFVIKQKRLKVKRRNENVA